VQYLIGAIVGIIVAFVLYKIADSLFSEGYRKFMSACYLAAIWPFIIFVILSYFFPSLIGNESWGYFLIYAPLVALFFMLFTILPVIIAHIACEIKYRSYEKPSERIEKLWWAAVISYFVCILFSFYSPLVNLLLLGILLVIIISIYRIIRKIKQKSKEHTK